MKGFACALSAEIMKLNKRAKYRIFFAIVLILYAALCVAAYHAGQEGSGLVMGGFLTKYYLPFIAFLGVHDVISAEIKDRSIFMCLVRPVSRMTVYIAKCVSVLCLCAIHMFVFVGLDYLSGLFGAMSGGKMQILYAAFDLIPLFTLIAFSALISMVLKSPAFSMMMTILLYIALSVGSGFVGLSPAVFTSYLGWHTYLSGGLSAFALFERIFAVVAPGIAFVTLGAIMLERKRF